MNDLLGQPRMWLLLSIVGALLILLLGWLLLISPQMSKAETVAAQYQTTALRAKEAALKKQAEPLPAMEAELASLYGKLPNSAGVEDLIKQGDEINRTTGITVVDFSVDPPTRSPCPRLRPRRPLPQRLPCRVTPPSRYRSRAQASTRAWPTSPPWRTWTGRSCSPTWTSSAKLATTPPAGGVQLNTTGQRRATQHHRPAACNSTPPASDDTTGRIYVHPPTAEEEKAAAEASAAASPAPSASQ